MFSFPYKFIRGSFAIMPVLSFSLFFWHFPDMFLEGHRTLSAISVTEKANAIAVFPHTMVSIPLIIFVALFFTFSV